MQDTIKIKKGLDIKLVGEPAKVLEPFTTKYFAITPENFKWLTPKLLVKEGDSVLIGDPLFFAKENEALKIVAPVSGTVTRIFRGEKRKIIHIEIESDGNFKSVETNLQINNKSASEIKETLLHFGLWPAVRQRPFGTIAKQEQSPKAIFINCFDSAPLAPDIHFLLEEKYDVFLKGIETMAKLTDGVLFLTFQTGSPLFETFKNDAVIQNKLSEIKNCKMVSFSGPHPAGTVGIQIHHLAPIQKGDVVWYVEPQQVCTIGNLFLNNKLDFSKIVAVTGGAVKNPHYYTLIQGASVNELLAQNYTQDEVRVISGNVLTGSNIGKEGYLGFYDDQITVIPESEERDLFGWIMPNFHKFSVSRTFFSYLMPHKKYNIDTRLYGGKRVLMFTDVYSKVFPFDLLPDQLLKACIIKDIDLMESLGIYEIVEEDYALCEFVCPSKTDCQQIVKDALWELVK